MTTTTYKRHAFSGGLLLTDEGAIDRIAASMRTRGYDLAEPILLYEGRILDGWHRYRAAQKTGVEPSVVEHKGTEAEAIRIAIQRNLLRRQMTQRQLAAAIIQSKALEGEQIKYKPRTKESTTKIREIAAASGAGETTVRQVLQEVTTAASAVKEADAIASGKAKPPAVGIPVASPALLKKEAKVIERFMATFSVTYQRAFHQVLDYGLQRADREIEAKTRSDAALDAEQAARVAAAR